jgi:hypothetical protein
MGLRHSTAQGEEAHRVWEIGDALSITLLLAVVYQQIGNPDGWLPCGMLCRNCFDGNLASPTSTLCALVNSCEYR